MKVFELIERLRQMPDQNATVVMAEGVNPHFWLVVSGVIPRGIKPTVENLDIVEPGSQPAVEIV